MALLLNNTQCFPMNLNIPLNTFSINMLSTYYCSYVIKQGKNKDKCCGRKKIKNRDFCYEHNWNTKRKKKKYINNNDIKKKKPLLITFKENIINKNYNINYIFNNEIFVYIWYKKYIIINVFWKNWNTIYIRNLISGYTFTQHVRKESEDFLITYHNDGKLFKEYIKKQKNRIKNKKKRMKKKLNKLKSKPDLSFNYSIVDVKSLKNQRLNELVDCGVMSIKKWPINNKEIYNNIVEGTIIYFHNFYFNDINKENIIIIYKNNDDIFSSININYIDFYNIFIKQYNLESVLSYIYSYYNNRNSIAITEFRKIYFGNIILKK